MLQEVYHLLSSEDAAIAVLLGCLHPTHLTLQLRCHDGVAAIDVGIVQCEARDDVAFELVIVLDKVVMQCALALGVVEDEDKSMGHHQRGAKEHERGGVVHNLLPVEGVCPDCPLEGNL